MKDEQWYHKNVIINFMAHFDVFQLGKEMQTSEKVWTGDPSKWRISKCDILDKNNNAYGFGHNIYHQSKQS